MSRYHRPRRRLRALLLLSLLAGCTYWKNEPPVGAAAVLTEARSRNVRVTKADGTRVELQDARIANDTLSGLGENRDTVRLAVLDVMQLEVRANDPYRTALIGVVLVGGLLITGASY